MPNDPQLLTVFVNTGSPDAFGSLVARHIDMVYAAALRQTRNPHDAEDITQAVFIILARKARTVPSPALLPAWLLKVTHFVAANARQAAARRRQHEQEAAAMLPTTALPPDPQWHELSPHLDAALARLSSTDRAAIIAHCIDQQPLTQLAAALHLTEPAARKRVQRALQRLRSLLAPKVSEFKTQNSQFAAALPILLATHALTPASPALASTVTTSALAALHGTATTSTAIILAKGVTHMMFLAQAKLALATTLAVIIVSTITGAAVHYAAAQTSPPAVASSAPATQGTPQEGMRTGTAVVIRGIVADEKGQPAADVIVNTSASPWKTPGLPPPTTHTVGDGHFTLTVDADNGFSRALLARTADGLQQGYLDRLDEKTDKLLDDVKIVLKPAREFAITVRDAKGTPVPTASAAASSDLQLVGEATCDAAGQAVLRVPADAPLQYIFARKPDVGLDYFVFWRKDSLHQDPYHLATDFAGPVAFVLNGATPITVRVED